MHFRDNTQETAYSFMNQDHAGLPFFGQFGTGSGKTYLGALFASQHTEPTVIALPTNNLITQTMEKITQDYPWLNLSHAVRRFYPMSAYPSPSRCEAMKVDYMEGEFVDEIIDRLKDSRPNLAAHEICLDSTCPKAEKVAYHEGKQHLEGAKVLLTTHHALLNDAWTEGRYLNFDYRYVIVDEADQIHAMAKLRFNRSITVHDLLLVKADPNMDLNKTEGLQALLNLCELALPKHEDKQRVLELIATIKAIMYHLGKEAFYYEYGQEHNKDWKIYFKNPAKILSRLYAEKQVFFLSATLSMDKDLSRFGKIVGAKEYSPHSKVVEATDFGRLNFVFAPRITFDEKVSFMENHREDPNHPSHLNLPYVRAYLQRVSPLGHTLVLTASADNTEALAKEFPGCVYQARGENLKFTINRLREKSSQGETVLFIAHGAWAGLDIGVAFKHVVIPRIPYPYPSDVENEPFQSYIAWVARKMNQGIGRLLRDASHIGTVAILDPRFPWSGLMEKYFGDTNVNSAAHFFLRHAIPTRFERMEKNPETNYGYNYGSVATLKGDELEMLWFRKLDCFARN